MGGMSTVGLQRLAFCLLIGCCKCMGAKGNFYRVFGVGIRSLPLKQMVAGSIPAPVALEI